MPVFANQEAIMALPAVDVLEPVANVIERVFSSVLSKRRQKKAAVEFFEEE